MNAVAQSSGQRRVLSRAQFRELLWADPLARVHAVLMGERVPGLEARLAAGGGEYDSLWPGALTPSQRLAAPWLACLTPASALSEWVLFEATAAFPEWGVLVLSPAPFLRLRGRLRGLCRARLPDGSEIPFPWMDPPVLALLLEDCDAMQAGELFGEAPALLLPEPGGWRWHRQREGRRVQEQLAVAAE